MKKLKVIIIIALVIGIVIGNTEYTKAAFSAKIDRKNENGKWNKNDLVKFEENGTVYKALLSADKKSCWLYEIILSDNVTELRIPESIDGAVVTRIEYLNDDFTPVTEINGFFYFFQTNILGMNVMGVKDDGFTETSFQVESNVPKTLTKIQLPDTVEEIGTYAFAGFSKVRKIRMPLNLKTLEAYAFYHCDSLTEVSFLENVSNIHFRSFEESRKLKQIKISKGNKTYYEKNNLLIKRVGGKAVLVAPATKKLVIPNGVKALGMFLVQTGEATSISISKSVKNIDECALISDKLSKISVSKKSRYYKVDGNCLIQKSNKKLKAVIVKKGVIRVSDAVGYIDKSVSIIGKKIKKVCIGKNVKKIISGFENSLTKGDENIPFYFYGKNPPKYSDYHFSSEMCIPNPVYVKKKWKSNYKKIDNFDNVRVF